MQEVVGEHVNLLALHPPPENLMKTTNPMLLGCPSQRAEVANVFTFFTPLLK